MTSLLRFPTDDAIFARLTERQREANIAAEREELRQAALFTLRNHAWHSRQAIEDAWIHLASTGTAAERAVALAKIEELTAETPAQVFARHAHRWPAILGFGAVWAAIMLALSGWVV
jgi:hypothetical protein